MTFEHVFLSRSKKTLTQCSWFIFNLNHFFVIFLILISHLKIWQNKKYFSFSRRTNQLCFFLLDFLTFSSLFFFVFVFAKLDFGRKQHKLIFWGLLSWRKIDEIRCKNYNFIEVWSLLQKVVLSAIVFSQSFN